LCLKRLEAEITHDQVDPVVGDINSLAFSYNRFKVWEQLVLLRLSVFVFQRFEVIVYLAKAQFKQIFLDQFEDRQRD